MKLSKFILTFRLINRSTIRLWAREVYHHIPLPWAVRTKIRRIIAFVIAWDWKLSQLFSDANYRLDRIKATTVRSGDAAAFLKTGMRVTIPTSVNPIVSVIVPVYNKAAYTLNCLTSISHSPPNVRFEVIVVDDCSNDETSELLSRFDGVRVLRNQLNMGFINACNAGAKVAGGEFVCFLNNDTQVFPGWLDELHKTFATVPKVGLVGSKIIYPDGRLQEAGGIVWRDGSAQQYGHLDDPDKGEYSYLRDADYVSGASTMILRKLFLDLGGFDGLYSPAYWEDADLAFKVRSRNLRVIYQPMSVLIHYEGITSGTNLGSGVKQFQVINQRKFFTRWCETLKSHSPYGADLWRERDRQTVRRLMLIDANTPRPDHDAGSLTVYHYLRILQSFGYKVTFIATNLTHDGEYTRNLQRLGVECVYGPHCKSIKGYIAKYGRYFDFVLLYRPYVGIQFFDTLRRAAPDTQIIYNTVDLHYLRERRQAALERSSLIAKHAERTRLNELRLISESDAAIVLSSTEKELLAKEVPGANIHTIPLVIEKECDVYSFEERRDILFIGGYQHPPNVDAVLYFSREILPGLRQKLPGIRFYALGSRPPIEIQKLACEYILVPGHQVDISQYFNNCRISIAPLRYGAGIKGKIGTSFSYGLPVVATSIAVEGMELRQGKDVLIADSPNTFIEEVVRLYSDRQLWQQLSSNGREVVRERYSPEAVALHLQEALTSAQEFHRRSSQSTSSARGPSSH